MLHERLGYADCESWRAFAFWPRIHELERHYTRRSGDLLGAVIAHEIGHVLLPQRPHAARGIMRATIDPTVLTFQGFEPGEVSRIRQVLAAGR